MDGTIAGEKKWQLGELRPQRLTRRDRASALTARGIELREGAEEILERHPELRSLLSEAVSKLREIFGEGAALALERFEDPGAPEEPSRLVLLVRTALDAGDAHALLTRFDETWWLSNSHRGKHLLQVSVEFV